MVVHLSVPRFRRAQIVTHCSAWLSHDCVANLLILEPCSIGVRSPSAAPCLCVPAPISDAAMQVRLHSSIVPQGSHKAMNRR